MKTKHVIIIAVTMIMCMLGINVLIGQRWRQSVNDAYTIGLKDGYQYVVDSVEKGLLDATQEDMDSVIVVTYYYDKKLNPNP